MRFEKCEPRIVFDATLGTAVEFDIDTVVDVAPTPSTPTLPGNIQFRDQTDDFSYVSEDLDPAFIDQLVATTESWASSPTATRILELDDSNAWRKNINHHPPRFHEDGYLIAERFEGYADAHTLVTATVRDSDEFTLGGTYMRQDHHYKVSFDVRHPATELSWLQQEHWAIVTQFWGPREGGETARQPPFAIYTQSIDGVPHWVVRSRGDSRRITQTGEWEEYHVEMVPMENIGDWNSWDIEFVPNPFGEGLVRTWLNGVLVSEWVDVKSNYYSIFNGIDTGPLNPSFGLYSQMIEDGMEAHFDNVRIESNGVFESSISGRVTGVADPEGATVFATNLATGLRYGAQAGSTGIYSLAVPRGRYTVTAVNPENGHQVSVANIDAREDSKIANLNVYYNPPAPAPALWTTTGDLNGDGKDEIINRLPNGAWQVTIVGNDGIDGQSRTSRGGDDSTGSTDSGAGEPTGTDSTALEIGTSVWTTWSTNVEWKHTLVADFTGDGLDDIAGLAENGQWWIAKSTGTGFQNSMWGKWTPGIEWLDVSVGDFNGDGKADIAGRAATNASWWISQSNGSGFTNASWGRWTTTVQWENVSVGDFNGDGRDDIAGRAASDGTWWISESNGVRFQNRYWGRFTKSIEWDNVKVGDFNGDGRSDIIARATSDGTFWVAESNGTNFTNRYYGRFTNIVTWLDITVTDVNGDGLSDLVGRADRDGSWWVARSDGQRFQNYYWGEIWDTNIDWLASAIADFDGDGTADLLGANTDSWRLSS